MMLGSLEEHQGFITKNRERVNLWSVYLTLKGKFFIIKAKISKAYKEDDGMKKILKKIGLIGLFLCIGHEDVWAADLRLNPDAIANNYTGDFYFKDLFSGTSVNECTFQDVVDCIRKYTTSPVTYSEKDVELSYTNMEKGIDICLNLYPYYEDADTCFKSGNEVYEAIGDVYDENKMAEEYERQLASRRISDNNPEYYDVWLSISDNGIEYIRQVNEALQDVSSANSAASYTGWRQGASNEWFYLENGTAVTGWKTIDGANYYFRSEDCVMANSVFMKVQIDGKEENCYLGEDGKLVTGWKNINGSWYYFQNSGVMVRGLVTIDGELYGFKEDGTLLCNQFFESDGKKYHFNENFADKGWKKLSESSEERWYYFGSADAAALTGYIDGIEGDSFKYYFWQDGAVDQSGNAHAKGSLAQGEPYQAVLQNGEVRYFADANGHLYTSTELILNGLTYEIDANGNVKSKALDYSARAMQMSVKQKTNSDCAITSIAAIYGYEGAMSGTADEIYAQVKAINGGGDYIQNWGRYTLLQQNFIHDTSLGMMYEQLKKGKPFIVAYWNGLEGSNYRGHYSLCVGYDGDVNNLTKEHFKILDVAEHRVKTMKEFEDYYVNVQGSRLYSLIVVK